MKKLLAMILAGMMVLSLAACSGNEAVKALSRHLLPAVSLFPNRIHLLLHRKNPAPSSEAPSSQEPVDECSGTNMLVAYFSYAENADLPDGVDASATASIQVWNGETTGNTGVVAAMIAETTGADLFSIQTVEKYPDTYDATIDKGQEEQNANTRPELATHVENLDSYDVIFLGFPNWWGDMPMAMYSFLDEVDLSGKTIVPFVTSGGSGFSRTISTIESMESGATVQEGLSISGSNATSAQDQVNEWLSGLGYAG